MFSAAQAGSRQFCKNQSQNQSQSQPATSVGDGRERTVLLSNGANIRGAHR